MNNLFVCGMIKWRSPTAENLFRRVDGINVRSAGTSRVGHKALHILDIPNDDQCTDAALIDLLPDAVMSLVNVSD